MKDDAELLSAFVTNRDEASFRELVERRIGLVYAVNLRRLRDAHLAQEATQSVFIALARKAADVLRSPSIIGWLHRSSCYESLNLMRAQTNRLARETEAERLGTTTGGPLAPPETGALAAVLDEILNDLPETDREMIIARYFSNFSYAEIGGQTGRSENAARMRVDRALARMKGQLEARGLASAGAVLAGLLPAYATAAVPGGLAVTVTHSALTALGTGAVATSLIFSMSTTKIFTAAAVFSGVAFIGFQSYENHQLRRDVDELRQQSAQLNEAYRRLEQQLSPPKTKEATTVATIAAPSPVEKTTSSPTSPVKPATPAGLTRIVPAGWHANGSNLKAFEVGVDQNHPFGGVASTYVKSTDDTAEKDFGGAMQSTAADQYKNQRVRLTGWIKTEEANNDGAHLWLRVDGQAPGQMLGFDNMDSRAPKGTQDWSEYSVVLDVPAEASSLNYGFFLGGKGQMWVNGVAIERVGAEVPTTNMLTPPKPLPTAPVNLTLNPAPASGG